MAADPLQVHNQVLGIHLIGKVLVPLFLVPVVGLEPVGFPEVGFLGPQQMYLPSKKIQKFGFQPNGGGHLGPL